LARRDPITRKEILEYLEAKVCTITYTPEGKTRSTVRVTLLNEYMAQLDNRPAGFLNTREAALFDIHSINALDIDNNCWVKIEIGKIIRVSVP
jgi:hypothetical protein